MIKKKLHKWKCTVCKHIHTAEEKPEQCEDCGSQSHKIKAFTYSVKIHKHADEPEAYD